jgi:carboxyl-terminal processing protease
MIRRVAMAAILSSTATARAEPPARREPRPPTAVAKAAPRCPKERRALVDLAAMRDAVKARMAYPLGGGVPVDALFDGLKARAAAARSGADHLRVLEAFVYGLGDHHAHLGTNGSTSARLVPSGATVWAESRDGRIVVTEVRPGSPARAAGLREGMIIERIDGAPVDALQPPPATPERAAAMRGFAVRVALAGTHEHDAEVEARGAAPVTVRLAAAAEASDGLVSLSWPRPDVARLRIHNALGNAELPAAFDVAMQQAVGAKALLLDLRDTPSGGDSSIAKPIMGWFVEGKRGYQGHQRGARRWVEEVAGRARGYRGQLLVLVDHWTGSMGEGVAIGLRAAAGASIVGTPMAGLRGAIEDTRLPCLAVAFRFPVERLFEVSGTPREDAQPDVRVTEAELAAAGPEDAVLARALAAIPQ